MLILLVSITSIGLRANVDEVKPLTRDKTKKITEILDQYKEYLDMGTYQASCLAALKVKPQSRYYTFKKAFEHFEQNNGKIIVELGTTRSFVHGGLPGCCSTDPKYWTPYNPENWDWGAGGFTRMALECLAHLNPTLHTVDLSQAALAISKTITKDFNNVEYHHQSSAQFLKSCSFKIDLLYLDTGDIDLATAELQLEEAKIIVEKDLIAKNGIILIDDVMNYIPGNTKKLSKATYSIPFLLNNSFELIEDEYQVILKKR